MDKQKHGALNRSIKRQNNLNQEKVAWFSEFEESRQDLRNPAVGTISDTVMGLFVFFIIASIVVLIMWAIR